MQRLVSPSAHLPPIKRLFSLCGANVKHHIIELGKVYASDIAVFSETAGIKPSSQLTQSPPAGRRTAHQRALKGVFDSGYASLMASDDETDPPNTAQDLSIAAANLVKSIPPPPSDAETAAIEDTNDTIRADAFERRYAINWLTGFISRSEEWLELAPDFDDTPSAREAVIQLATMLISACTGTSICGAVTRHFTFGSFLIQVNDDALPSEDHTAVGLNTWGSARILAERMVANPAYFGLVAPPGRGLKVLELGAGTGLLSLVARRILEAQVVMQKDDSQSSPASVVERNIVATDYHPSVLANLGFNISTNAPSSDDPGPYRVSLTSEALDWRDPPELEEAAKYDVILGADIIYERSHAEWIRSCVEAMLKKPGKDGSIGGVFWLVYPERPTHQQELDSVQEAFFDSAPVLSNDGWVLRALDEEAIERKRGIGRADEERYRLWRIGWCYRYHERLCFCPPLSSS